MNGFSQSRPVWIAMLAILLLIFTAATATACPTCKDSLSEDNTNMAQGYFWSILFMMSMPFLILAGMGAYFYLLVRRARLQQSEQQRMWDDQTRPAPGAAVSVTRMPQEEPVEV